MNGFSFNKLTSKKLLFIITLLIVVIISFSGCNNNSKDTKFSLDKGEYLVSFSRAIELSGSIVEFSRDGSIISRVTAEDGISLHKAEEFDNKYLFFSERANKHFVVEKNNTMKPFYIKDFGCGTSATNVSNGLLLTVMNVGNSENGYTEQINYQKSFDEQAKSYETNCGFIGAILSFDNKLCFHYEYSNDSSGQNNSGLKIFDLDDEAITNDYKLNNPSLLNISNESMKLYGSDVLLCGYDANTYQETSNASPIFAVYDITKHTIKKTINFDEGFLPISIQIFDNKIFILDENGLINILDKDYNVIGNYRLSDNALQHDYKDYNASISQTILNQSELHIYYRFTPDNNTYQFPGAIHVYDIFTGELKRVVQLKLPGEKEWWGEDSSMILINKN